MLNRKSGREGKKAQTGAGVGESAGPEGARKAAFSSVYETSREAFLENEKIHRNELNESPSAPYLNYTHPRRRPKFKVRTARPKRDAYP